MNRPLGRLGAAATLGQHCPQMTQRHCRRRRRGQWDIAHYTDLRSISTSPAVFVHGSAHLAPPLRLPPVNIWVSCSTKFPPLSLHLLLGISLLCADVMNAAPLRDRGGRMCETGVTSEAENVSVSVCEGKRAMMLCGACHYTAADEPG